MLKFTFFPSQKCPKKVFFMAPQKYATHVLIMINVANAKNNAL